MFGDRKIAHIAAYLLNKAGGERLELVKLMMLMYLADRESLRQTEGSISDDRFIKDRYGPVLEHTLELMEGQESIAGEWEDLITSRGSKRNSLFGLNIEIARDDLDELSPLARRILDQVWNEFGSKTADELVDYTHTFDEWKRTSRQSAEIPLAEVLKAVGCPEERAEGLAAFHAEQRRISEALTEIQYGRA